MPAATPATRAPIARVLPLVGISHLDREFDYLISEADSKAARPGVRVRIRFAGRLVDAILVSRHASSEFDGKLRYIERVISPFVVYPPEISELVESLARRYGGVRSDIIRTAIPPRHAKSEEADLSTPWEQLGAAEEPDLSAWSAYQHGESFVDRVVSGGIARAAWQIAPGDDWPAALAALAVKVALGGGGVLMVVPDQRDLDRLEAALRDLVGPKQICVLAHSLGPQGRYRRYLSALVGQARIVIGTRSAAFAPVNNLQLATIYCDGEETLVDNLKPYVHAREVLSTRSALQGCSLVIAGHSRTAEAQLLVESGWAHDLVATRETLAAQKPEIVAVGTYGLSLARDTRGGTTSLSGSVYQAIRASLDRGEPVLVQAPRKGNAPVLACGNCRTPARCRHCNGPVGLPPVGQAGVKGASAANDASAQAVMPTCRWCGRIDAAFRCTACGSPRLRALVLGSERTAEELGRAFPATRVIVSGGNRVIDVVDRQPMLVVSTPGAEPRVTGGAYGAGVLLDTGALLGRQDLRAGEDALAKWAQAATLVAPAARGGTVLIAADGQLPVVAALTSWDMVAAAAAELAARREVHFPPAAHMAAIDGADASLDGFLDLVDLPADAEVLGPVPLPPGVRLAGDYDVDRFGPPQRILVRVPQGPRSLLGTALRSANAARSARKDELPLRIQVDPVHIG